MSNPSTAFTDDLQTLCGQTCPSAILRLLTKIYGQGIHSKYTFYLYASFAHREFRSVAHHLLQLGPDQRSTLSDRPNTGIPRTPVKNTNLIQN